MLGQRQWKPRFRAMLRTDLKPLQDELIMVEGKFFRVVKVSERLHLHSTRSLNLSEEILITLNDTPGVWEDRRKQNDKQIGPLSKDLDHYMKELREHFFWTAARIGLHRNSNNVYKKIIRSAKSKSNP